MGADSDDSDDGGHDERKSGGSPPAPPTYAGYLQRQALNSRFEFEVRPCAGVACVCVCVCGCVCVAVCVCVLLCVEGRVPYLCLFVCHRKCTMS